MTFSYQAVGKKINPAPPSLFIHSALRFPAYLHSSGCSLHVCLRNNINQAKCCLSSRRTSAPKAISPCPAHLFLLFTSMLYFSLCLFVFASRLCPPNPTPPKQQPRHASPRQLQDTPAMLNPRSTDRWRKRGQTPLPVSRGAGPGAIIMANSSPPPSPGSRKRSEDGG